MTKLIILPGLGQTVAEWECVSTHLKDYEAVTINLFAQVSNKENLTLEKLYSDLNNQLSKITEPFYLCGLSLGGLLTLMYATKEKNSHLKGIIVSGAIYKSIPRFINALQTLIFYVLPQVNFVKMGLTRKQVVSLMKSIEVDLTTDLTNLTLPSLIICGEKDRINLNSAEKIHNLVDDSYFQVVNQGGHELNKDKPEEFANLITNFISQHNFSTSTVD